MNIIEVLSALFSFIALYSISTFVFFNQKRNRVNVWFFILMNTLSGIFLSIFLTSIPVLNIFGNYSMLVWKTLCLFLLCALPFILFAYINAKTRFQRNNWVVYGSFAVIATKSIEISLIWYSAFPLLEREVILISSAAVSALLCLVIVLSVKEKSTFFLKGALLGMITTPVLALLWFPALIISLFVFGLLLFVDLRRHNAKVLHQKEIANFVTSNTQDGIIVTDASRKIIYCNKQAREFLGLTVLNSNGEALENVISLEAEHLWESGKKRGVLVIMHFKEEKVKVVATFSEIKRRNKTRGFLLVFSPLREA